MTVADGLEIGIDPRKTVALGLFLLVFFFAGDYIIPLGFSAADLGIGFVAGLFS